MECGQPKPAENFFFGSFLVPWKERKQATQGKKERKKTDNPREGWGNGTPPPHRDFKERRV